MFCDASARLTASQDVPATVKVTMPHFSAPMSCTVTPLTSLMAERSRSASHLTRAQIAGRPRSIAYSAATPIPILAARSPSQFSKRRASGRST
jgi:hypothetical protein